MTTVTIDGIENLLRGLQRAPAIAQEELRKGATAALLALVADLKQYPGTRPGQRYRRTGLLGRTWGAAVPTFDGAGDGFIARLVNTTPYGRWVQSPATQAWMHVGRWQTTQDVVDANQHAIEDQFRAAGRRFEQQMGR